MYVYLYRYTRLKIFEWYSNQLRRLFVFVHINSLSAFSFQWSSYLKEWIHKLGPCILLLWIHTCIESTALKYDKYIQNIYTELDFGSVLSISHTQSACGTHSSCIFCVRVRVCAHTYRMFKKLKQKLTNMAHSKRMNLLIKSLKKIEIFHWVTKDINKTLLNSFIPLVQSMSLH